MRALLASSFFCLFVLQVSAQWEFGAFVGTVTPNQTIGVWNVTDDSSFIQTCQHALGTLLYSPAYNIDISTRNFVYLHASGSRNTLTTTKFYLNTTTNTIECGEKTTICDVSNWKTNDTLRIFYDPTLNITIMVDTVYISVGNERQWFNAFRYWKISAPECRLEYVDVLKTSPIIEGEEDFVMYDYSNHRLYTVYSPQALWQNKRLRAVDVRGPTLLYDYRLSFPREYAVYGDFDASSGKIVLVAGDPKLAYLNTTYQGYVLDPITFEMQAPSTWQAHHYEFGPSAQNIRIDWRSGSFVSQTFDELRNELNQNVWDALTGENYVTFSFNHYVDNGWFYDPLLTIVPLSVNTASESELVALNVPEVSARNIVAERKEYGNFQTVEAIYDRVPNVTESLVRTIRPYITV